MAWRDELRPASFRGTPFFVEQARTEQGQHADEHQFPGRETAEESIRVAHLGQGPRRYRIDAFVVGPDYLDRRDALEAALTEPGPGRLVHPYRGERTVSVVGKVVTTESKRRGGYAKITFEVVDVSETGLRRRADSATIAERDLDAFIEDAARDFDVSFADTDGIIDAYNDDARSAFADAQSALRAAHDAIAGATGSIRSFEDTIRDYESDLVDLIGAPSAAARALQGAIGAVLDIPADVLGAVASSFNSVRGSAEAIIAAFGPVLDFTRRPSGAGITPGDSASRRRLEAVTQLVRATALAHVSRVVLDVPHPSRSAAAAVRDDLDARYARLEESSTASGVTVSGAVLFEALEAARVSVHAHLSVVAASLPDVDLVEVPVASPALVIAHELYGDATRADEIVARNDIEHPGRVPAGVVLEVLRE